MSTCGREKGDAMITGYFHTVSGQSVLLYVCL